MSSNLTRDDVGKPVVDADGTAVGTVSSVQEGTAYVEPDPDTVDKVRSKLNWGDEDRDTYPLKSLQVSEISDDEVRLG